MESTKRSYSSQPNEQNYNSFQHGNRLAGRNCMITGGTSGIGFAIAERFLQEGASTIVLVGRSQKRLEEAAAKLGSITVTESDFTESSDYIATRVPEGNNQQSTQGKIRLLVGDVSDAGSWMRELEKEMVNHLAWLKEISPPKLRLGKCGHPSQRSRNFGIKYSAKV